MSQDKILLAGGFRTVPPPLAKHITLELYYGVSSPWALLGAPVIEEIAKSFGLKVHLKPIVVVEENGGIRLKSRHEARQAYHALDLYRVAKSHHVPMIPSPKYYPQAPGTIELAGQAIIRVQQRYGVGSQQALRFSHEIQRCIWVTEEGDHTDIEVLRAIARRCGISDEAVKADVIDARGNKEDAGVQEWDKNHEEAVQLGIFGTPNYVVNGEIFWGQDRLDYVKERIMELINAGATPVKYEARPQT